MSKTTQFLLSRWPLRLLALAIITMLLFVEWAFLEGNYSEQSTTRLIGLTVVLWQLMELKIQTE